MLDRTAGMEGGLGSQVAEADASVLHGSDTLGSMHQHVAMEANSAASTKPGSALLNAVMDDSEKSSLASDAKPQAGTDLCQEPDVASREGS